MAFLILHPWIRRVFLPRQWPVALGRGCCCEHTCGKVELCIFIPSPNSSSPMNTLPVRSVKGIGGQDRTSSSSWKHDRSRQKETEGPSSQSTDWIHALNTVSFTVNSHPLFYLLSLSLLNPAFLHLGLLTVPKLTNSLLACLPSSLPRGSLQSLW